MGITTCRGCRTAATAQCKEVEGGGGVEKGWKGGWGCRSCNSSFCVKQKILLFVVKFEYCRSLPGIVHKVFVEYTRHSYLNICTKRRYSHPRKPAEMCSKVSGFE